MKQALIFMAILLVSGVAFAHPASEIYDAVYTAKDQTLSFAYRHSVKDPVDHFIQGVEIRLHDTMIISQVCSAQSAATGGDFIYKIPNLKKGDVLEITLLCNKSGKKSAKLILK